MFFWSLPFFAHFGIRTVVESAFFVELTTLDIRLSTWSQSVRTLLGWLNRVNFSSITFTLLFCGYAWRIFQKFPHKFFNFSWSLSEPLFFGLGDSRNHSLRLLWKSRHDSRRFNFLDYLGLICFSLQGSRALFAWKVFLSNIFSVLYKPINVEPSLWWFFAFLIITTCIVQLFFGYIQVKLGVKIGFGFKFNRRLGYGGFFFEVNYMCGRRFESHQAYHDQAFSIQTLEQAICSDASREN